MLNFCNCPNFDLCQTLGRHIHGRLFEIWEGKLVDPEIAQQYRSIWFYEAGLDMETIKRLENGQKVHHADHLDGIDHRWKTPETAPNRPRNALPAKKCQCKQATDAKNGTSTPR